MVTFRISCLLTILSAAEEKLQNVFQIEENGNSFMIGCFALGNEVLQLREALERPCNSAEMY